MKGEVARGRQERPLAPPRREATGAVPATQRCGAWQNSPAAALGTTESSVTRCGADSAGACAPGGPPAMLATHTAPPGRRCPV